MHSYGTGTPAVLPDLPVVVAVAAAWSSLTPSLLPRGPLFQGVVTGAAAAAGYGLGVLLGLFLRRVRGREFVLHPVPRRVVTLIGVLGTIAMFRWFAHWQDELRTLMGVAGLRWYAYPIVVIVALIVFALLIGVVRLLIRASRRIAARLGRVLPARLAGPAAVVLVVLLVIGLLNGVVVRVAMSALNDTFEVINAETHADSEPPAVPERSGGPASLVSWDSLGRQGRAFVAGGPSVEELTTFNGQPAVQPIRAYTGLGSAENPWAEADLAVAELRRMGAFDRAVLGVGTTTGTGWINSSTADALEYLYNGNTALVAMQYSYLPSWISFLVDKERAKQAGRALFDAVYAAWSALPPDHRPKLVVFGESLGSFGGEAAFAGIQDLAVRTDGALFVGPTGSNVLWGDLTNRRDAGSPQWLPVFDHGRTVHFVARAVDLDRPPPPWQDPRVVYLQHPSDPITWWTPRLLFAKPDWLREERGYDVLPSTRWIPLVTFLQVSADMAVSVDVPDGHGHTFRADIADAWAAILRPPHWNPADTQRLRAALTGDDR